MRNVIPEFIKPYLWSYDTEKMDPQEHWRLIITSVLNRGDRRALAWIFSNYAKEQIKLAVREPLKGAWDKKSLNYWALILDEAYNPGGVAAWR